MFLFWAVIQPLSRAENVPNTVEMDKKKSLNNYLGPIFGKKKRFRSWRIPTAVHREQRERRCKDRTLACVKRHVL